MKLIYIKFVCVVWLLFIAFTSCGDSNRSSILLQQAAEIIEEEPKLALALLDSINKPEKMDKDNYMKFIVTHVQAKFKNYKDINNDTLLFEAQKYFENSKDHKQAALAHFYAAEILAEGKQDIESAFKSLLKSEQRARQAKNNLILGRSLHTIAKYYKIQSLDSLAILNYKEAITYYSLEKGTDTYKLSAMQQVGISYMKINDSDSAKFYFEAGLKLAEKNKNKYYQMLFYRDLGIMQETTKDYNLASTNLNKSLELATSKVDSTILFLNLAIVYNAKQQPDSAKYYTSFVENSLSIVKDKKVLHSMYGALVEHNSQTGNHKVALDYQTKQHAISLEIAESNSANILIKVTLQHELELQQEKRKKAEAIMYLCLVIVILVIGIVVYKHRTTEQRNKDKIKLLETEKESIETKLKAMYEFSELWDSTTEEWNKVSAEIDKLAKKYRVTEKPELIQHIEQVIANVKTKTHNHHTKWTKEYLKTKAFDEERVEDFLIKRRFSISLINSLNSETRLLLLLCCNGCSKQDIANVLSMTEYKVQTLKHRLFRKMKETGITETQIDKILYPREIQ